MLIAFHKTPPAPDGLAEAKGCFYIKIYIVIGIENEPHSL
jgi:hypothetical protein